MMWTRKNKLRLYHYLLLRCEEQYDQKYNVKDTSERWDKWLDSFEIERVVFKNFSDLESCEGRGFRMDDSPSEQPSFCFILGDFVIIKDPWSQRALKVRKDMAEKFILLDFRTN